MLDIREIDQLLLPLSLVIAVGKERSHVDQCVKDRLIGLHSREHLTSLIGVHRLYPLFHTAFDLRPRFLEFFSLIGILALFGFPRKACK